MKVQLLDEEKEKKEEKIEVKGTPAVDADEENKDDDKEDEGN